MEGRPCTKTRLVCLLAASNGEPALCDRNSFIITLERLVAASYRVVDTNFGARPLTRWDTVSQSRTATSTK
jgi:hypothetical protein